MMRKLLISTVLILLLVVAAYYFASKCKSTSIPQPTANTSQVIQTAYMVVSPAAVKGDTIVFQNFSSDGSRVYLHFPLGSPCSEVDLPGSGGNPPHCVVTADVKAGTKAQYAYYVDQNPKIPPPDVPPPHLPNECSMCPGQKSVCRTCCQGGCKIVILHSGHDQSQLLFNGAGSGQYQAIELLIDETGTGTLVTHNAAPYPDQQITWYRSGTLNTQWTITFDDATVCKEGKTFTNINSEDVTCTVIGAVGKSYQYKMRAGQQTGTGWLYVTQPPPPDLQTK